MLLIKLYAVFCQNSEISDMITNEIKNMRISTEMRDLYTNIINQGNDGLLYYIKSDYDTFPTPNPELFFKENVPIDWIEKMLDKTAQI